MKYIIVLVSILVTITACTCTRETANNPETKTEQSKVKQEVAPNSFYQEKFINGADFFARGNEPFWTLELGKEMKFKTLDDISLTISASEEIKMQDAVTRFHSQTEEGELIVTLTKKACEDNMSGEPFDYKVKVEVRKTLDGEFKTYEGCGGYLFDSRLNDIWVMEEMTGAELSKDKLLKGLPTFEFNVKDMRFSGHAGCNNLTCGIELKGNKIIFGNIAATMMACPNMEIERAVVDALNKKSFSYKIENLKLTLENQTGVKMVFKKVD